MNNKHLNNYICECGKTFINSQALNGHKAHCKKYLGEQRFNKDRELLLNKIKHGNLVYVELRLNKKAKLLELWISEKHTCETCGKVMTEKYGSGRFCSKSCANTRNHSEITKQKIRESLLKRHPHVESLLPKIPLIILKGQKLAQEINLSNSPYSEYNLAFKQVLVENRESYKLCLYVDNKCVKSEIVLIYRYIMACHLLRKLEQSEVVHHIDGNPQNNAIDNLMVMSIAEHAKYHARLRKQQLSFEL